MFPAEMLSTFFLCWRDFLFCWRGWVGEFQKKKTTRPSFNVASTLDTTTEIHGSKKNFHRLEMPPRVATFGGKM
jgi:wyosine [tRNA(Phe)-imidazoG37] synthetase (radical SAM superfamily)